MDLNKIKKRERNATFVLLAGGWEMNERQMERLVGCLGWVKLQWKQRVEL